MNEADEGVVEPGFLLDAVGIEKSFGATEVLKKTDLRVAPGEIHALLGGNGAGKSTLIRIVSGSHRRDGGTIRVDGRDDYDLGTIAVVFQELALLPHMTVAENIYLPHRTRALARIDAGAARAEAADALALIDEGLAREILDRPVAVLDLHERQFVEIARALSSGARLLLLDEPTANLTFAEAERLFAVLRRLARRGIATVLVSHRMNEIRAVADVCTILRDGRTVVDRRPLAEIDDHEIVEAMGQKAAETDAPAPARHAAAEGAHVALTGPHVAIDLAPGSILGLAGAPTGPDEVIGLLTGAAPRSRWRLSIDGTERRFASPNEAVRSGVGYVSGDRGNKGILATLPILDNIVAALRVVDGRRRVMADEARVATAALDRLSIRASSIDALPQTLSGGTQQKLLLARWIERRPRLLVLEEPTRGVDVGTKREIYAIIREAAAAGTVVVWWSTEFSELVEICDRIVAFDLRGEPSGVLEGDAISDVALARATGMAA